MKPSRNVIEETLLAWSVEPGWARARLDSALARVAALSGSFHAESLRADRAEAGSIGIALWHRRHPDRCWPLWHSHRDRSIAFTGVPTGVWRVSDQTEPAKAVAVLANSITANPETLHRLDPPFAVAALSNESGLVVGADPLGIGRLFEHRFDGGVAWSNRAGALPLFADEAPAVDERAWRIFAAAGWFLGETTPLRGVHRVPASMLVTCATEQPARPAYRDTKVRAQLVEPRRARRAESSAEAAAAIHNSAAELGRAWSAPISAALTGGRDSRVSAAAAIAAELPVRLNTGDAVPGEAEIARRLVAAAPVAIEHEVYTPDPEDEHSDPLLARVERMHLVHDGLRNPQEVRRPTEVPHSQLVPPALSGHGGELGHGFYYPNGKRLRGLRRARGAGPIEVLERAARRTHSAAAPEGYEEYLDLCLETLSKATDVGLHGPEVLDFFYAAERLPHRSGLGARSGRTSACTVLEFVRGAFDLKPRHRLRARLHRDVIGLLVPAWKQIPFFAGTGEVLPDLRRRRIWEGQEGDELDDLISAGGAWESCFDARRVREIWSAARSGKGRNEYEHVFYRVVWREAFERHVNSLDDLRAR